MIPKSHFSALQIIFNRLNKKNIYWAITGSMNMALQGLLITPNDIDIQTDKEGAKEIGELLAEYSIEPIEYKESDNIKSFYGKLEIEGVQVEIMGAVQMKLRNDNWEEPVKIGKYYMTVVYKKIKFPVLDLEYELEAYRMLGREEKILKLEKYLGY